MTPVFYLLCFVSFSRGAAKKKHQGLERLLLARGRQEDSEGHPWSHVVGKQVISSGPGQSEAIQSEFLISSFGDLVCPKVPRMGQIRCSQSLPVLPCGPFHPPHIPTLPVHLSKGAKEQTPVNLPQTNKQMSKVHVFRGRARPDLLKPPTLAPTGS